MRRGRAEASWAASQPDSQQRLTAWQPSSRSATCCCRDSQPATLEISLKRRARNKSRSHAAAQLANHQARPSASHLCCRATDHIRTRSWQHLNRRTLYYFKLAIQKPTPRFGRDSSRSLITSWRSILSLQFIFHCFLYAICCHYSLPLGLLGVRILHRISFPLPNFVVNRILLELWLLEKVILCLKGQ